MRPPVCQGLPQPNLRQTSNGIVILRERLSLLRQDNFVSLALSALGERSLAAIGAHSSALEIQRLAYKNYFSDEIIRATPRCDLDPSNQGNGQCA
jgi:hypothetical protein